MIVRWLDQDTGAASGVPPAGPVRITDVQFTLAGDDSWQTVVYTEVKTLTYG